MAKQLTETEMLWANFVKAVRSEVRLKHSIRADNELNVKVPLLETRFMAAVKAGREVDFVLNELTELSAEVGS